MLRYEIKPSLLKKLNKIQSKENKSYLNILEKIKEIINSENIDHYKNLKKPIQHLKRVHVNTHFVLTFNYLKKENLVVFIDYQHHDKAYY